MTAGGSRRVGAGLEGPAPTPPEILTTAEAAAYLRCSVKHVEKLCRENKIRAAQLGKRSGYRIRRTALDAYLTSLTPKGPRPTGGHARRAAK